MPFQSSDDIMPIVYDIPNKMIEFPRPDSGDRAVQEIFRRGNIPLLVGNTILAEVANDELKEGLEASMILSGAELARLSSDLAGNIADALNAEPDGCDVANVAADAAALFVLCLRRNNVLSVDNIPACSVSFNNDDNQARLTLTG